jgi:hypothetical protein
MAKAKQRVHEGDQIEGTITGAGAALGRQGWDLIVFLRPWRDASGAVQRKELRVEVPMHTSDAAASRAMSRWDGKSVVISVARATPPGDNLLETAIAGSMRKTKLRAELASEAKRQAKPRYLTSRVLGRLRLDRELSCYEGRRQRTGARYRVSIETPDPDDDKKSSATIERGAARVLDVERQLPRIRKAIADQMLDLYNDNWRQERRVFSRAAFVRCLRLQSVDVGARRTTLHFACGELFYDHVIEVRMSPQGKIREICLAG